MDRLEEIKMTVDAIDSYIAKYSELKSSKISEYNAEIVKRQKATADQQKKVKVIAEETAKK